MKNNIVILTGAGISAESGLQTFRGQNGLWEGYNVMEVATPEGWRKNQEMVLDFYNKRREAVLKASPNQGHIALKKLEEKYNVTIITQNIDNLHERAGSENIIHLHGEILKSRSSLDESLVYECRGSILPGDKCEKGSQLRPNIVWFNEAVPMMDAAINKTMDADIFMVIGTSMQVYPAASLIQYVKVDAKIFIIDPEQPSVHISPKIRFIQKPASTGVPEVVKLLMNNK